MSMEAGIREYSRGLKNTGLHLPFVAALQVSGLGIQASLDELCPQVDVLRRNKR